MNKKAKGQRIENLAKKLLEEKGYLVEKKNWSKYGSPDFFGWFDLVAVKGDKVTWIQVKSNKTHFYTARKKIGYFLYENQLAINCEIWLYEGRNRWRIEPILPTRPEKTS